MLTVALLMMSLSACREPLYHVAEQCSPVFVYIDETRKLVDVDQSYCSVRQYEFSLNYVGPIQGTALKKSLTYCDRCVGFKNYAETATFWEEVRRSINKETKRVFGEITK